MGALFRGFAAGWEALPSWCVGKRSGEEPVEGVRIGWTGFRRSFGPVNRLPVNMLEAKPVRFVDPPDDRRGKHPASEPIASPFVPPAGQFEQSKPARRHPRL